MDKPIKFLLLASLGLNLILIGGILGWYSRGCAVPHRRFLPPPQLAQQLSPEKRELFEGAMKSLAERSRDLSRRIQEKRDEIQSILTGEPFDAKAFEQKSHQLHELHGQMKAMLDQTLEGLATQMNREERRLLAGMLRPPPPPTAERPHFPPPGGPQRGFPPPLPPPPGPPLPP